MSPDDSLRDLPGADLVLRGLEDCSGAHHTPEAALVEIARTRLERLGLRVCASEVGDASSELRLYERLGARHPEGSDLLRVARSARQLRVGTYPAARARARPLQGVG